MGGAVGSSNETTWESQEILKGALVEENLKGSDDERVDVGAAQLRVLAAQRERYERCAEPLGIVPGTGGRHPQLGRAS